MKIKLALLTYTFFSIHAFSIDTLSFTCTNGVHFDSSLPLLEDPALSQDPVLSKSAVCGLPTQFNSSCGTNLIQQGNEYNFSWRCDGAFGDLYFTTQNGGYAEFRCMGEGVESKYANRIYQGCQKSNL